MEFILLAGLRAVSWCCGIGSLGIRALLSRPSPSGGLLRAALECGKILECGAILERGAILECGATRDAGVPAKSTVCCQQDAPLV